MLRPPFPPKRLGEVAEVEFQAIATRLGYFACKPYGDSAPFDWIVVGAARQVKRIQVKAAFVQHRTGYYHINVDNVRYAGGDVDLIVGYVAPEDAWYLIPLRVIAGRASLALYPHKPARDRLWGRYRDNWWRLGRPSVKQTKNRVAYGKALSARPQSGRGQ